MDHSITLRMATPADAPALLNIYAPYVRDTAITFEYDVPSLQEFSARMQATLAFYPYLAALQEGRIVGYAYASPFKERRAYDWAVETSIYVEQGCRGRGIGRQLHDALEGLLRRQGILNMCACIAVPHDGEDEFLTLDSVRFHERLGYRMVGRFDRCGCKFGRWYDMVWMERILGDHPAAPEAVKPVWEVLEK